MKHPRLFVFDIETVVDDSVAHILTDCPINAALDEKRQAITDYHLKITDGKNAFPRQLFHQVVAISFLEADITYNGNNENYTITTLRSGGKDNSNEEELLAGFFSHLNKPLARLVTFNGRTFDLPVLKYRAMKYGIKANWLYPNDKWENYHARNSQNWHADVLDLLSDYGTSARIKLNEICSILGLPGKFGLDGSMVQPYYDDGKIDEIRSYCETDVLNTYLVYIRLMQHRGTLKTDDYNHAIAETLSMIQTSDKQNLKDFYIAWEESSGGKFYL